MNMDAIIERAPEALREPLAQSWEWVQSHRITAALAATAGTLALANWLKNALFKPKDAPPMVPSQLPVLGNAVPFGERPIDFLIENYKKFGPVFTFKMFGSNLTYLLGSEASHSFWSSDNDILNAEDVYNKLTGPVFGPGVAYDVPHKVFLEQKQMAKEGLTKRRFATYTGIIEKETINFVKRWGDKGTIDLLEDLSELIVYTATHCLHGKDTRAQCDSRVARLYADLDGGFTPLAWFFPSWIPFPSFVRRDRAYVEMRQRFDRILEHRRQQKGDDTVEHFDLMHTYLTTPYKKAYGGRKMTNTEVTGMMIALLMAGQHTSSTVSSWTTFFIAANPKLQKDLYEEQKRVFQEMPGEITLEHLDQMPLLHATVREALRMHPPIYTIMRKARSPFKVKVDGQTYVIPKGNQVCVSPTVNHYLDDEWDNPEVFDPYRFLEEKDGRLVVTQGEQVKKGGKFKWVPFGAGRHRCIGFEFAQVQIRCVLSVMLRNFEFTIPDGKVPEIDYHTMLHQPKDPYISLVKRKDAFV